MTIGDQCLSCHSTVQPEGSERLFEAIPTRHQQRDGLQQRGRLVLDAAPGSYGAPPPDSFTSSTEHLIRCDDLQRRRWRCGSPALLNLRLIVIHRRS